MKLPTGYRIIFLSNVPACFWATDDGKTGPPHLERYSETYIMDCALAAWKDAGQDWKEQDWPALGHR